MRVWSRHLPWAVQHEPDSYSQMVMDCRWRHVQLIPTRPITALWKSSVPAGIHCMNSKIPIQMSSNPYRLNTSIRTRKIISSHGLKWCHEYPSDLSVYFFHSFWEFLLLTLFQETKSMIFSILSFFVWNTAENCMFVCPELDACVNSSVWCDGVNHCPSGYDESFTHCSALLKLPAEALVGLSMSTMFLFCGICVYIYRWVESIFEENTISLDFAELFVENFDFLQFFL